MTFPGGRPHRVAILSDVHSNLHALRAVLDALHEIGGRLEDPAANDAAEEARTPTSPRPGPGAGGGSAADLEALPDLGSLDGLVLLGDLVGYNAYPAECLRVLRSYPHVAIRGNHDDATVRDDTGFLNMPAAQGVAHSREQVGRKERTYLRDLPEERTLKVGDVTLDLYHGSPYGHLHEYIYPQDGPRLLRHVASERGDRAPYLLLLGHTHVAMGYLQPDATGKLPSDDILVPPGLPNPSRAHTIPPGDDLDTLPHEVARLDVFGPAPVALANPGSVGQPRDGDPRAAFAVLDASAHRLTYHRVPYDVDAAQEANRAAGLPESTIDRLRDGR